MSDYTYDSDDEDDLGYINLSHEKSIDISVDNVTDITDTLQEYAKSLGLPILNKRNVGYYLYEALCEKNGVEP